MRPLRNHIGVIAGVVIVVVTIGALVALAVIGFRPALELLVVAFVGVGLVIAGTRIQSH